MLQDTRTLDSEMDGKAYQASHLAATLRRNLWREHLGLIEAQELDASKDPNAQPPNECGNDNKEDDNFHFVADPLSDKVWDLWTQQATTNTGIYRELFRADPDDHSMCTSPVCAVGLHSKLLCG